MLLKAIIFDQRQHSEMRISDVSGAERWTRG